MIPIFFRKFFAHLVIERQNFQTVGLVRQRAGETIFLHRSKKKLICSDRATSSPLEWLRRVVVDATRYQITLRMSVQMSRRSLPVVRSDAATSGSPADSDAMSMYRWAIIL
jgi:hypothetical protein